MRWETQNPKKKRIVVNIIIIPIEGIIVLLLTNKETRYEKPDINI